MTVPKHIFRGYDLRGIADTELTEDNVRIIARAYATFLYQRRINEVIIGRDNRLSGERIIKTLTEELLKSGINVTDIGMCLSQIIYFSQYFFQSKGAIMVSASHNPKEYNGMKFAVGFSDTMISEEIIQLRDIAEKREFKTFDRQGVWKQQDIFQEYKKDILKRFLIKDLHYKVVVDTGNDTAGLFLPTILREAGCEVIEQNTELDGNFPLGTPDPTESEFLERLSHRVRAEGADMGFAYDPDGDRIGIVDDKGNSIWNDILVAIFAKDILEYMPGSPIVFNALCSKVVKETIESHGGKAEMWLTGHSFIKARVKETRAPFGGELSGHFFFMDNFYGHDDSAYATLRLLTYLQRKGQKMSEAVAELPQYISSPEIKLGLADDIKFEFIRKILTPAIKDLFPGGEYNEIDGIRAESGTEMAIIRASQNGPYITIKFESKTQAGYDNLKKKIAEILRSYKEIDFSEGVNTHAFE